MKKIKGTKDSICNDCFDKGIKDAPCIHIQLSNNMTNIDKIIEEFDEKMKECMKDLNIRNKQVNIGDLMDLKELHKQKLQLVKLQTIEECLDSLPEYEKAHTYSSENSEVYIAFDSGQKHYKEIAKQELNKLK